MHPCHLRTHRINALVSCSCSLFRLAHRLSALRYVSNPCRWRGLPYYNMAAAMTGATWGKLAAYLPTGTFLVRQTLAPLTTDDGKCDAAEKAVTGVFLAVLCCVCFVTSLTDSVKDADGVQHYGIMVGCGAKRTFRSSTLPADARVPALPPPLGKQDWVHAGVAMLPLAVMTLLTPPVTTPTTRTLLESSSRRE